MAKGKGLSRSGKKHKKPATHDIHRQFKAEPSDDAAPTAVLAVERLLNAQEAVQAALGEEAHVAALSCVPQAPVKFEPPRPTPRAWLAVDM